VKRVYWLFEPHCSNARRVPVAQRTQRVVISDPNSAVPIDPPFAWRCDHEVDEPAAELAVYRKSTGGDDARC
jgi:hypothetical protein